MEGSAKDKPATSVSGSGSKLRYPLRSSLKSKEAKPPVSEFSSSSSRRGRNTSAVVSQSVGVLDLSAKDKPSKPPRRLSIPTQSTTSSAAKPASNIPPISEARRKRSTPGQAKTDNLSSYMSRAASQRKPADFSSASYWLTHIKLSESAQKHMISLGFFKLALEAGCEPLQRMREELKSYTSRHNLSELEDTVKGLFEIYNISENSEQCPISETCSQVPEEETQSSDNGVQNSPSAVTDKKLKPKTAKTELVRGSAVASSAKMEMPSKNDTPARTRRSLSKSSANSRNIPETSGCKIQKKAEKKSKLEHNQEKHKMKKQGKKEPSKDEGQGKTLLEMNTVGENKENTDAPRAEEIRSAQA